MKKTISAVLLLMFFVSSVFAQASQLFIIERSKNANVVRYDANLLSDGTIDQKDPVSGYWLLYAKKNGEKEKLSLFDKQAYGFKAKYNKKNENYDFSIKAVPDKKMTIITAGGKPKVKITINNKESYLKKVYINADGIDVNYYVLYGTDTASNAPVEEKIVPAEE